jgi:hypothetical protein
MSIPITKVKQYKEVYVVDFDDGMIEGCKYSVVTLITAYMSFVASYGTKFYKTYDDAEVLADKLNKKGKNQWQKLID